MIKTIEVHNFKCFMRLRLNLGALTLLTGFNGGGKSTAIQPLLLLAQWRVPVDTQRVSPNGSLVSLGAPGDVLPPEADSANIVFSFADEQSEITWILTAKSGDRLLTVTAVKEEEIVGRQGLEDVAQIYKVLGNIVYISAIREGTSDYYLVPNPDRNCRGDVGVDGRFASFWYDQLVDDEVPLGRRHQSEPATSLRKQLDAWIGTLFPGAQANVQAIPHLMLYSLQFRLSETGEWRRPANVGYGFTYAFPILVALLAAEDGQIVVIDSPEAHLHPAAQSQMGRILAQFATAGVQIIVETHSDHLLNGARLAVRDKSIAPTSLQLHFFTGARKGEHGVVSPALDSSGRINEWPDGFFDQSEKDLAQLSSWE